MAPTPVIQTVGSAPMQSCWTSRQRARQIPRRNFPRVKTGCLTCRRRKKKCDESRPRCAGCRRNQENCEWPPDASSAYGASSPPHHAVLGPNEALQLVRQGHLATDPVATVALASRKLSPGQAVTTLMLMPMPPAPNLELPMEVRSAGPCAYTVDSGLLLSHYLGETGLLLATVPVQKSPFLINLVPLAVSHDLLMHTLLAISGTHLAFKRGSDARIQAATWQHYLAVIRGLRKGLDSLNTNDADKVLNLLMVLILLCHYEVISGDLRGNLFHHLRASRQIICSLLAHPDLPALRRLNDVSLGFCLELYAYTAITNSLKPRGSGLGHPAESDSFVMCLDHLSDYPTFGTMFASSHGLFELIPQVTLFAAQRLAEEENGTISPYSYTMHGILQDQIELRQPPTAPSGEGLDSEQLQAATAAEIIRYGLRISLATAMAGSVVSDPETLDAIHSHIRAILDSARIVGDSRWATILLWPLVVAGSCMTDPAQREELVMQLKTSRYYMKHVLVICEVLQSLWETDSPHAFGPYGLYLMEQKGYFISVL